MSLKDTISTLVQEQLAERDLFLVSLKTNEANTDFTFFVDGISGVAIADCAKISRKVSAKLEELALEDENYRFAISSPGADAPLRDIRQYPQHVGRILIIDLENEKIEGELLAVTEEEITLNQIKDKKKKVFEKRNIQVKNINMAKVQISFNNNQKK